MSEWITDRRPTAEDAYYFQDVAYVYVGYVWVTTENGIVLRQQWNQVFDQPWMPITPPEPYVEPKRWKVTFATGGYIVYDSATSLEVADSIPTYQAAERIAAIYEEVMP